MLLSDLVIVLNADDNDQFVPSASLQPEDETPLVIQPH